MTGVLMIVVGIFVAIAGFTGRWRAVLAAFVPQFARTAGATATPATTTPATSAVL